MFNIKNGAYARNYRGGGYEIPENSDLNNLRFMEAGGYNINSRATTQTLTNCPASSVFVMHVEHITVDRGDWIYIHREIVESGANIFHQFNTYRKSTDQLTCGKWKKATLENIT